MKFLEVVGLGITAYILVAALVWTGGIWDTLADFLESLGDYFLGD